MALLQVNTFSQALSRIITFHIILPNDAPPEMLAGNSNYDRPMKTLYLLHGFSGSTQDWLTGSLIPGLAYRKLNSGAGFKIQSCSCNAGW